MNYLNKKRVYWLLQVGGWLTYAIINMVFARMSNQLNIIYFSYIILLSAWFLISTHVFRVFLKKFNWLTAKVKHIVVIALVSIILLSLVNFVIHIAIWVILGALDYEQDLDPIRVRIYILTAFVFYLLWTLLYFIIHYVERRNATLKWEALKNEIELNNLKTQLNPHFIFNALNSIRALVDEEPGKSKDAITQLSNILRGSLMTNKSKLISFSQELNAVQDYLNLESIRYEERLSTDFDIDPKSGNFSVPPMMIQTLVENGIKHGISKLKEGGKISIKTEVKKSKLNIQIRNNGQLFQGKLNGTGGVGLENTRKRLQLLYDGKASFKIKNEDSNTVLTEVNLPQNI